MFEKFIKFIRRNEKKEILLKKENINRRKHPRIQIVPLNRIFFYPFDSKLAKKIQLVNLSSVGLGLDGRASDIWPKTNDKVKGRLCFSNKEKIIVLKIVHITPLVVGCIFKNNGNNISSVIEEYFNLEFSALKMIEINPKLLKKEENGSPRWFTSVDNCELYVVLNDEKINYFSLSFMGNYLEGGENMPVNYGQLMEDENEEYDKAHYKGSEIIQAGVSIPKEIVSSAKRIVNNVSQLNENYREMIINLLNKDTGTKGHL